MVALIMNLVSRKYGEYLLINPKLRHRIHNAQERRDSLRFLSNFGLVNLEVRPVVLEIPFDLFAVDI